MLMRSAKVPLSPSSALQTMYFLLVDGLADGGPLDAGREAGAAAAAQAGVGDDLADVLVGHGDGVLQPDEAAVGAVVRDVERVDHADALEGQARLLLQPVHVLGLAQAQRDGRRLATYRRRAGHRDPRP